MIKGKKINMRFMEMDDIDEYISINNTIENRGEFWGIRMISSSQMKKKISENNYWDGSPGGYKIMIITDKSDNIIGEIHAYAPTIRFPRSYEIGYQIFKPEDRGKGYMSEAMKMFCEYIFRTTATRRIQAIIHPENIGSIKMSEKCGFEYEATFKNAYFYDGKYADIHCYAMRK